MTAELRTRRAALQAERSRQRHSRARFWILVALMFVFLVVVAETSARLLIPIGVDADFEARAGVGKVDTDFDTFPLLPSLVALGRVPEAHVVFLSPDLRGHPARVVVDIAELDIDRGSLVSGGVEVIGAESSRVAVDWTGSDLAVVGGSGVKVDGGEVFIPQFDPAPADVRVERTDLIVDVTGFADIVVPLPQDWLFCSQPTIEVVKEGQREVLRVSCTIDGLPPALEPRGV